MLKPADSLRSDDWYAMAGYIRGYMEAMNRTQHRRNREIGDDSDILGIGDVLQS